MILRICLPLIRLIAGVEVISANSHHKAWLAGAVDLASGEGFLVHVCHYDWILALHQVLGLEHGNPVLDTII